FRTLDLQSTGNSGTDNFVRRQSCDVEVVHADGAIVWAQLSCDQIEQGRLARAIRPDDCVQSAARKPQRNVIDGCQPAKTLRQSDNLKCTGRTNHQAAPTFSFGCGTLGSGLALSRAIASVQAPARPR